MLVFSLSPGLSPAHVEAAVKAGDVAAVVLRPSPDGEADSEQMLAVAEAIQTQEAAALLEGTDSSVPAGFDGAHVPALSALESTLKALKPDAIVGAGGLSGRHDAMTAGESGADYVLFGPLAPAPGDFPRTLDLVSWWAELFEVPCVGVASSLEEVEALAAAGADFVALGESLVSGPGVAATVAAAQARLDAVGPAQ